MTHKPEPFTEVWNEALRKALAIVEACTTPKVAAELIRQQIRHPKAQ